MPVWVVIMLVMMFSRFWPSMFSRRVSSVISQGRRTGVQAYLIEVVLTPAR